MAKETLLIFKELDYKIGDITYAFDDTDPEYTFCVTTDLTLPQYKGYIVEVKFQIDYILKMAEQHNPSMVRYVKTMIESYRDEGYWELRAFEALEAEGFPLNELMDFSIRELTLTVREN